MIITCFCCSGIAATADDVFGWLRIAAATGWGCVVTCDVATAVDVVSDDKAATATDVEEEANEDDDVVMVDVNGLSKDNIALGDATLERCLNGFWTINGWLVQWIMSIVVRNKLSLTFRCEEVSKILLVENRKSTGPQNGEQICTSKLLNSSSPRIAFD